MSQIFKAACVQLDVGPDIIKNLDITENLIRQAADEGARFVATPENTCFLDGDKPRKMATARAAVEDRKTHPVMERFAALASELNIWLLAGSIKLPVEGEDRLYNRSLLFGSDGKLHAHYDKIHLYDVDLPSGEVQRESHEFKPGTKAVSADMADLNVKLGLTICYDVRFPHLYRDMAKDGTNKRGVNLFTIPAAFTVPTGEAHWEVMLRARAIECGAFVLAPAQGGSHEGARKTYGHSLIIDPWGRILAHKNNDTPGVITADIDLGQVDIARNAIQQLKHDVEYSS